MLKRSLLLLVAFLLFSSVCYSGGVSGMADLEIIEELMQSLEMREAALIERENELAQREASINLRESLYNERVSDLQAREDSWSVIVNSWKSYNDEQRHERTNSFWRGFAIGAAVGGSVGLAGGFALGVKIPF